MPLAGITLKYRRTSSRYQPKFISRGSNSSMCPPSLLDPGLPCAGRGKWSSLVMTSRIISMEIELKHVLEINTRLFVWRNHMMSSFNCSIGTPYQNIGNSEWRQTVAVGDYLIEVRNSASLRLGERAGWSGELQLVRSPSAQSSRSAQCLHILDAGGLVLASWYVNRFTSLYVVRCNNINTCREIQLHHVELDELVKYWYMYTDIRKFQ